MMKLFVKIITYVIFLLLLLFNSDKSQRINYDDYGIDDVIEFVENKGQFADIDGNPMADILHVANINSTQIYSRQSGISFVFKKKVNTKGDCGCSEDTVEEQNEISLYDAYRFDMNFVGISDKLKVKGTGKQSYFYNYFQPQCPDGVTKVPVYKNVLYENVYDNIDFILYAKDYTTLEYDFIVKPGADPNIIKLSFSDTNSIELNPDGSLKIATNLGNLDKWKPFTYQMDEGYKKEIESSFELFADGSLGFKIGEYDKSKDLIIDPVLRLWGTYYGGTGADIAYHTTRDNSSNIYICGQTSSANGANLIATAGAYQVVMGGTSDAFVAKFTSGGVRLWGTYYGGTGIEIAYSVSTDNSENVFIGGYTQSANAIASVGAHQTVLAGTQDGFIAKFDQSGALQWGTYFGGTSNVDQIRSIAVDLNGDLIIGGYTQSTDQIATAGSFQNVKSTTGDGFMSKFTTNGVQVWGTYYGGTGNNDIIYGVAVDSDNSILITGRTNSAAPAGRMSTAGSHQPNQSTASDAFVAKFDNNGARLWGTYYGGNGNTDIGWSIAVDAYKNIYVCGQTNSATNIGTAGSHQPAISTAVDAFLVKFNSSGVRQWGTFYGGTGNNEIAYDVVCDEFRNVYICGRTNSNLPANCIATPGAHQATNSTLSDAFVARFSTDGVRNWGTYYGGTGNADIAWSIAPVLNGLVYVAGQTNSPSVNPTYFIATPGSHQPTRPGGNDGYLVCFQNTYTITPLGGAGGTILPSTPVVVPHMGSYSFSFVPDAGAVLYGVIVDGVSVGQTTNYTFNSVVNDHTIDANFLTDYYIVRAIASTGGNITPEGDVVVVPGESVRFMLSPNQDYQISAIYLDGILIGTNEIIDITNITSNHRLQVFFKEQDTDNDGATERVEKLAPNSGDGNFDGIQDNEQAKVASLPTPAGSYLTVAILNDCESLENVSTSAVNVYNPQNFVYPFGFVKFNVGCQNVALKLIYHDVAEKKNYIYRKYGPTPPRFLDSSFYTMPNANVYQEQRLVNNIQYDYYVAKFSLVDGSLGDDTEEDGLIYDPGGLSIGTLPPIPTLPEWGAILMGAFIIIFGILYILKIK